MSTYSLVPGVAQHVKVRQMNGLAGPGAAVLGVGVLGAAINGAVEGLFVYGVTRLGAGVESTKARKAALWAGGIVFGLSTVVALIAGGAAEAVAPESTVSGCMGGCR